MKTTSFLSRLRNNVVRPKKRRRSNGWHGASENLEARQLLTAGFMWDGDALQVSGSEGDDFIAVQQDDLGLKVFTEDGVFSEFEGRSFATASQISVSGLDGNDVLFSYQSEVPVSLSGDAGQDFLYSDQADSILTASDTDWVFGSEPAEMWENAFGISGLALNPTTLNGTPTFDADGRIALDVELSGEFELAGRQIAADGNVGVSNDGVDVSVAASVDEWNAAFGIDGLNLSDATIQVQGHSEVPGYDVAFSGNLDVAETTVEVQGDVAVQDDVIDAVFSGEISEWNVAFGVAGLDLADVSLSGSSVTDEAHQRILSLGIEAGLNVEGAELDVAGQVEFSSDSVDAVFSGELTHWDDAFGIADLDLSDLDVRVSASSDRVDHHELRVDVDGEADFDGTTAVVNGGFLIEPGSVSGNLNGTVSVAWNDAFGITGLDLSNTSISLQADHNNDDGGSLQVDIASNLSVAGTAVAVTGLIGIDADGINGSLHGEVTGTWNSAFGIDALNLDDTVFSVTGTKTAAGSELSFDIDSSLDLFGTNVAIGGLVDVSADGLRTDLRGAVSGGWADALGIPGLSLRDTELSLTSDSSSAEGSGFNIDLDTDLKLFGSYIGVTGRLGFTPSGIEVSFTPPNSLDFTNLLGIQGFSLGDADLTVTADANGLDVTVASMIEIADVDVEFEGAISVARDEVTANLTGRVAEFRNAFDVPGLNLNDVVLNLGAESGPGGASLFVGLGAGIEIGSKELEIAGLLGFGSTGWEVAFRGSIDSLSSDDVIDFANTLNTGADPDAARIPDGTLGDLELRDAYINFAPRGGNEALGIDDGFGIGGEFFSDGKLIASGEFVVDLQLGAFEVGLEVPNLELGPVELSDVVVDIRLAPQDSHYHVAGTAAILGADVSVEGYVDSDSFMLKGSGNVEVGGINAEAEFTIDNDGIRFVASTDGGAFNGVKDVVTHQIRAVANAAQTVIDQAQAAVDTARSAVVSLEADLKEARAEAQREVDKVKSKINAASAVVSSARKSRDYWYKVRSSRYKAWKSAVSATKRAPWYKKAYYKGIEVGRYASYTYAKARYATQAVVYKVAVASHKALKDAAGWVLDSVGVEANPEVLRLKALLAVANVALDTTEAVLNGVEKANEAVFKALDIADSFRVNRITFSGRVSDLVNAGVGLRIDYTFAGEPRTLEFDASTDDLSDQLADRLLAIL